MALYVNYPLTVTAGEGGGVVFKRSLSQEFPRPMLSPKEGWVRMRGFSIPNILRTMATKTRAHLDNAPGIHKLDPKIAELKR